MGNFNKDQLKKVLVNQKKIINMLSEIFSHLEQFRDEKKKDVPIIDLENNGKV